MRLSVQHPKWEPAAASRSDPRSDVTVSLPPKGRPSPDPEAVPLVFRIQVEVNHVRQETPVCDDGEFELSRALLKQLKTLKAAMRRCDELRRRAKGI